MYDKPEDNFVQKVTTAVVSNAIQALGGLTVLPASITPPAWLDDAGQWPADEVLVARNGLFHLPSFVENKPYFLAPTPAFFTFTALDYDFQATAPEPKAWLEFLSALWPEDLHAIELLQEWIGYCLLPETRQQKILLGVGPKRSGKGTIARVSTRLLGKNNVVSPTLSSLAESFGLWPLLDKTLAIIPDARLSGRADQGAIVERLLSISGEDGVTVNRKFLAPLTVQLKTRIMLLTNELPRLGENSGALASRFIILPFCRSWYGREDIHLTEKLLNELPGILLWAIAGWKRLQERGHFVQPESGRDLLCQLEHLASPISQFVQECCVIDENRSIYKPQIFEAWRRWCAIEGKEHPGDLATFGRNLLAAVSSVHTEQPRTNDGRVRVYRGIGLRE